MNWGPATEGVEDLCGPDLLQDIWMVSWCGTAVWLMLVVTQHHYR